MKIEIYFKGSELGHIGIEHLTSLGASNPHNLEGTGDNNIYYTDLDNNINYTEKNAETAKFVMKYFNELKLESLVKTYKCHPNSHFYFKGTDGNCVTAYFLLQKLAEETGAKNYCESGMCSGYIYYVNTGNTIRTIKANDLAAKCIMNICTELKLEDFVDLNELRWFENKPECFKELELLGFSLPNINIDPTSIYFTNLVSKKIERAAKTTMIFELKNTYALNEIKEVKQIECIRGNKFRYNEIKEYFKYKGKVVNFKDSNRLYYIVGSTICSTESLDALSNVIEVKLPKSNYYFRGDPEHAEELIKTLLDISKVPASECPCNGNNPKSIYYIAEDGYIHSMQIGYNRSDEIIKNGFLINPSELYYFIGDSNLCKDYIDKMKSFGVIVDPDCGTNLHKFDGSSQGTIYYSDKLGRLYNCAKKDFNAEGYKKITLNKLHYFVGSNDLEVADYFTKRMQSLNVCTVYGGHNPDLIYYEDSNHVLMIRDISELQTFKDSDEYEELIYKEKETTQKVWTNPKKGAETIIKIKSDLFKPVYKYEYNIRQIDVQKTIDKYITDGYDIVNIESNIYNDCNILFKKQ